MRRHRRRRRATVFYACAAAAATASRYLVATEATRANQESSTLVSCIHLAVTF